MYNLAHVKSVLCRFRYTVVRFHPCCNSLKVTFVRKAFFTYMSDVHMQYYCWPILFVFTKSTELYVNIHFISFLLVDILVDYKTHWHTFGLVLGQLYFERQACSLARHSWRQELLLQTDKHWVDASTTAHPLNRTVTRPKVINKVSTFIWKNCTWFNFLLNSLT